MALSDYFYTDGTITVTNGSTAIVGTGTAWALRHAAGAILFVGANFGFVGTVEDENHATLTLPWAGASGTFPYTMWLVTGEASQNLANNQRLSEIIQSLVAAQPESDVLSAIAALVGAVDRIIVFTGPNTVRLAAKSEFTQGVEYDRFVNTLAERAAYDLQLEGFSVLVADVGDDRSAIYSKDSDAAADWSDPAYLTGPIGLTPNATIGTVTSLPPGSAPTVTITGTSEDPVFNFGIPAGRGWYWESAYNPATAYERDDVVRDNGSSWILTAPTSTGNAPPVFPVTSNAFWDLVAAKGQDGTGTGDVVGPASAADDEIVVFNGPTGKAIRGFGVTVKEMQGYIDAALEGVIADGSTDNTTLLAAAIEKGRVEGKPVLLPVGVIKTDTQTYEDPRAGQMLIGRGRRLTTLVPTGSGTNLLHAVGPDIGDLVFRDFGIDTSGTGMRPIFFDGEGSGNFNGATAENLYVKGNLAGALIFSSGQIINVRQCNLEPSAAGTDAIIYESFNQNCQFHDNIVGGIGNGVKVIQNGALSRLEGLSLIGNKFINTGDYNVDIGNSFEVMLANNAFDQATQKAVWARGGAALLSIVNNWCGVRTAGTGNAILVESDTGPGLIIGHNRIRGGAQCIAIAATASSRVSNVIIDHNTLLDASAVSILMDSVNQCIIQGNRDIGTPASGSWATGGTLGAGSYTFTGNRWHNVSPGVLHASSFYKIRGDSGIVGDVRGVSPLPGSATTAIGVTHGLNPVLAGALGVRAKITPRAIAGAQCYATNHDATHFDIGWATSGTPQFDYEAWVGN